MKLKLTMILALSAISYSSLAGDWIIQIEDYDDEGVFKSYVINPGESKELKIGDAVCNFVTRNNFEYKDLLLWHGTSTCSFENGSAFSSESFSTFSGSGTFEYPSNFIIHESGKERYSVNFIYLMEGDF